jgi:hypothetical protein
MQDTERGAKQMKPSIFSRYALSSCVAAAMIAGCGGSQPPIGAPGAIPQTSAIVAHADRGKSWMLSEAKGEDLLYVSNEQTGVSVFSYPDGPKVGSVSGGSLPIGLCSDSEGNVFIVDREGQQIFEYAHGGTNPITTLEDTGNDPQGCGVDPNSGDLAVAGGGPQVSANIAIYPTGSGSPKVYDAGAGVFAWCTYDSSGNIFASVGGSNSNYGGIVELPKGGSSFMPISIDQRLGAGGAVQWDGSHLYVGDPHGWNGTHGPTTIYRVQVSGSTGTVTKTIQLWSGTLNRNPGLGYQFWIQGRTIVSRKNEKGNVGLWRFPAGGKPLASTPDRGNVLGMTVSVAPRR